MLSLFFHKYKIVIILLLVIILCGVCSKYYKYNEYFDDTENEMSLINSKSSVYFPYISDFVYTNLLDSVTTFTSQQQQQLLHFLPSYADGMCSWITGMTPSCSNFFINNISYADPYEYNAPNACKNIESMVGMDKSQCEVRMLNNIYTLRKKCIRFTTSDQKTNAAVIGNITPINSSYIVNISHNAKDMDMFALLRPNLISFGNFGLYKIEPLNTNSSIFSNYSSKHTSNTFVITPTTNVTNPILNIYPSTGTNNFVTMANNQVGWNVLANVYFMNYEQSIYPSGSNVYYNTFNFVVDHQYLKTQYNMTSPLYSETITFNTTSSTSLFTSLVYKFNVTPPTNNSIPIPFFSISLNGNGIGSQPITCDVHQDFTNIIYKYINTTDNTLFANNFINWHIVVICSLDMVIILALFRDLSAGTNLCFMTQTSLRNGTPIYIQYLGNSSGQLLDSTNMVTTSQLMTNHYSNFNNVCQNTAVPNLALVAKYLGYNI